MRFLCGVRGGVVDSDMAVSSALNDPCGVPLVSRRDGLSRRFPVPVVAKHGGLSLTSGSAITGP